MERVIERCCGLDVHKKTVVACVRVPGRTSAREQHVRTFGTTTAELLALRDWLGGYGVTHVAMESTGVYWRPIFYGRSAPRRERSCSYPKSAACTIAISSRRRSQRPRSSVSQNGRDLSNVLPRSSMANPVNPWTVAGLRMSVAMFQAWLGAVPRRSRMVPASRRGFGEGQPIGHLGEPELAPEAHHSPSQVCESIERGITPAFSEPPRSTRRQLSLYQAP
jgi:hypothetical protein